MVKYMSIKWIKPGGAVDIIDESKQITFNGKIVNTVIVMPQKALVYNITNHLTIGTVPDVLTVTIDVAGNTKNVVNGQTLAFEKNTTVTFTVTDSDFLRATSPHGFWGVRAVIGGSQVYSGWKNSAHSFSYTLGVGQALTVDFSTFSYYRRVVSGCTIYNNNDQPGSTVRPISTLYTVNSSGTGSTWSGMDIRTYDQGGSSSYSLPDLFVSGRTGSVGNILCVETNYCTSPYAATKISHSSFTYSCSADSASTAGLSTSFTCRSTLTTNLYNASITLSSGASNMTCYAVHIKDLYAATWSNRDGTHKKFSSAGGYIFTSSSSIDLSLYASAPTWPNINHITCSGWSTNRTFYQWTSKFNQYGSITASDHIATIKRANYSLSRKCYANIITSVSDWGNWNCKVINTSPVLIYYQYNPKKVSNSTTSFGKPTIVAANSTNNFTITDQSGFSDDRLHIQATGFEQTTGGTYRKYGTELWIKNNDNNYLY